MTYNNFYKEALMDICKKQKMPFMFEKLYNESFNSLTINKEYVVKSDDRKKLVFDLKECNGFPGEELISQRLTFMEYSRDYSDTNLVFGRLILTYHNDMNRWTGSIHLFDEEKKINRISNISSVELF